MPPLSHPQILHGTLFPVKSTPWPFPSNAVHRFRLIKTWYKITNIMRTCNCHNTVVFLPFCALVLFDPARRLQIQEHQWNFRNQISAIWLHKPFTFTEHLLQAKKEAQSARHEACKSGGQRGPRCLSPGPPETRFRCFLQRDARRARVHPSQTEASSAQPRPSLRPQGLQVSARLSSNLWVHQLRLEFAPGQVTPK